MSLGTGVQGSTCPLLATHGRIHANLFERLREAKEQGWLGEVAAIETTIAAATQKLETMHVSPLDTPPRTWACPAST